MKKILCIWIIAACMLSACSPEEIMQPDLDNQQTTESVGSDESTDVEISANNEAVEEDQDLENKIAVSENAEDGNTEDENAEDENAEPVEQYGPTELHEAAYSGNLELVKKILASKPEIDGRDSFGGTALHAAMFQDNIEIVSLLIEYGMGIDTQGTNNKFTPLHDAVWSNNLQAAKMLIENGADMSIKNNRNQTPLEKAIADNKSELVEYFESLN
jgi:ankyrin repeat protein